MTASLRCSKVWHVAALAVVLLCPGRSARAQVPLGPEFQVNTYTPGHQLYPKLAAAGSGEVLVVWQNYRPAQPYTEASIAARAFDRAGAPASPEIRVDGGSGTNEQLDVGGAADRFVVVWNEFGFESPLRGIVGRVIGGLGTLLSPVISLHLDRVGETTIAPHLAVRQDGSFLVAWSQLFAPGTLEAASYLRQHLGDGRPARPPLRLSRSYPAQLASNGQVDFVALHDRRAADRNGIVGRLLDVEGNTLGPAFEVNTHTLRRQTLPDVAADGNGRFVVVWMSRDQDGFGYGIYGQRFAADGERLGGEFRVNATTTSYEAFPSVSADAAGNFVVSWEFFDPELNSGSIRARVFRSNGAPAGNEFRVSERTVRHRSRSSVALTNEGLILAAWQGLAPNDDRTSIFGRAFARLPPRGDHACTVDDGRWDCDTGRDGGAVETSVRFAGRPGDVPLLGDLDGDERDELCVYRGRQLLCSSPEEPDLELAIAFGTPGDRPLLGDVDGDGRDDLCLRRADGFLCDTRHDGGLAEWRVKLGFASDQALLGDLDGDGTDEPCVARPGRLTCAGRRGETITIPTLARAGEQLLLGDLDNDGHDDPCLRRGRELLCDTTRRGGPADVRIDFGRGGEVTLIGKLDGWPAGIE